MKLIGATGPSPSFPAPGRTSAKQGVRQEALRALQYLFLSGEEMARGDFKTMLGMGDRGAVPLARWGRWSSADCSGPTRRKARFASACQCVIPSLRLFVGHYGLAAARLALFIYKTRL